MRSTTNPRGPRLSAPSVAALAAVLAACGQPGGAPPTRPNVVLVSLDTLRADALGSHGSGQDTSPNLDALAARGVRCADAHAPTSWTLPSHVTMLTGLSISAHGMCDERLLMPGWVTPEEAEAPPLRGEFLGELLGRAGYTTAGFFTWEYLDPRYGFGLGFETYERVGGTLWSDPELRARFDALVAADDTPALRAWRDAEPHRFDAQLPTAHLAVDRALSWLDDERQGDEPFFLFLHLFDAHDDYVAPEPFTNPFDPDYDGPIDGTKVSTPDSPIRGDLPARDLAHLRARYLGEVAWVDHQVGRLLDALEAADLAEDTLVVVTADHGEEFYEHGHKTHRTQLYRESTQVPLILAWPAGLPAGRVVEGPVGLVDLVPTVASLADVPGPEAVSGRDLAAVLRGEAPNAEATYLGELLLFRDRNPVPERHLSLRAGEHAWFRVTGQDGASTVHRIDHADDPLEAGRGRRLTPGSPDHDAFEEALAAARAAAVDAREAAPPRRPGGGPLDAAAAAELDAMGYTGGREAAPGSPPRPAGEGRLCLDGCVFPLPPDPSPASR